MLERLHSFHSRSIGTERRKANGGEYPACADANVLAIGTHSQRSRLVNKNPVLFLLVLALGSLLLTGNSAASPTAAGSSPADNPWSIAVVDSATSTDVGRYVSLALPETGIPHISYYDAVNRDLRAAYHYFDGSAPRCNPTEDWSCKPIDEGGDVGQSTSIDAFRDQKIGIAYFDSTNSALKVAIWSCTVFVCSWDISTVKAATVGAYGQYTSLRFDTSGIPHIAYSYRAAGPTPLYALQYAHYVGSGGNCGEGEASGAWECETVTSEDGSGYYPSLALNSSNSPVIVYYNSVQDVLRLCTGPGNWYCWIISMDGGAHASLALDADDEAHIAYYNPSDKTLRYAWEVGSGGNCGHLGSYQCDTIATIGDATGLSLALDESGLPVIAYQDASTELAPPVLKIARPIAVYDNVPGNCGPSPSLFHTWQCNPVDNGKGGGHLHEADSVSVKVNSGGLLFVAYSEYDDYENATRLKLARQYYLVFLPLVKR